MTDEVMIWTWLSETNIQAAVIGPVISSAIGGVAYRFHAQNSKKVALASLIQDIERLAIEHWCSDPNDNNNRIRCTHIQRNLQTLSWRINQNCHRKKQALIDYRQAVTGDDFTESNREILTFQNPRITLISEKAKNLRKALGVKRHH